MVTNHRDAAWRIGELALRAGTSTDTIRYYERLGLLGAAARSEGGYRLYGEPELRRLRFIRRAKLLGLSLEEIRELLGLAEEGQCRPLRRQVAELLRGKIDECEVKLVEVRAFKASLEERYRLALASQDQPTCSCAAFPANCACLPVQIEEVSPLPAAAASPNSGRRGSISNAGEERQMDAPTIAPIERDRPTKLAELTVLNTGCDCGCDGNCGCGAVRAQPVAEEVRDGGYRVETR